MIPEAKILNYFGSKPPASIVWLNKEVSGLPPSSTPNNVDTIASSGLVYGKNVVFGGKTTDGEWVDVAILKIWLIKELQRANFELLCSKPKINYSMADAYHFVNTTNKVLHQAYLNGGIREDYKVDVKLPDSTNRKIEIYFKANLVGAIVSAAINGVIYL